MAAPILYSGPGKVHTVFAGTGYSLSADGEMGAVKAAVNQKRTRRAAGQLGYLRSTLDDLSGTISMTPFDSWLLLPVLYPAYLGIDTSAVSGGTAAALQIGVRPHDVAGGGANDLALTKIWTPDGRLYNFVRTAITKPPGMKLGVGQGLYTGLEISCLTDPSGAMNASSAFLASSAITESGASDPDATSFAIDFINGHWTGAWGAVTGFTALDAEDGWDLTVDAKFSPLTVQKRTYHMQLDSVEIMVKARLTGQTHSQLAGKILGTALGATLGESSATALVLTGPAGTTGSAKTITIPDCEVFLEGQGFEFGGNKLGTGEVAFVSRVDFASGQPTSLMTFSA